MKRLDKHFAATFAIILVFMLLLAACAPVKIDSHVYADNAYVAFIEPQSATTTNSQSGFTSSTEKAQYLFSKDVNKTAADKFISYQEYIFDYLLRENYVSKITDLKCYLLNNYETRAEVGKVFIGTQDVGTYKQILHTLEALTQQSANYALLYGLSNRIAAEIGFKAAASSKISDSKIKEYTNKSENKNFLDLVYPCFLEQYAGKERAKYSAQIALKLTEYAAEKHGAGYIMNLLRLPLSEFEDEFVALKNAYLVSVGSSTVLTKNEIPVFYGFCSAEFPLMFITPHATFYIKNTYADTFPLLYGEGALTKDYDAVKNIVFSEESNMARVDEFFCSFMKNSAKPFIVLCGDEDIVAGANGGAYYANNATIKLSRLYPLAHEYTHHVVYTTLGKLPQFSEAISTFVSQKVMYYSAAYAAYGSDAYAQMPALVNIIERFTGRKFDITKDQMFQFDFYCVGLNNYTTTEYSAGEVSLANYIYTQYGENIALQVLLHPETVADATGKTLVALISEWEAYLKTTYAAYLTDIKAFFS